MSIIENKANHGNDSRKKVINKKKLSSDDLNSILGGETYNDNDLENIEKELKAFSRKLDVNDNSNSKKKTLEDS